MPDDQVIEEQFSDGHPVHQIDGAIRLSFHGLDCVASLLCRCGEPICSNVHHSPIEACNEARHLLWVHVWVMSNA